MNVCLSALSAALQATNSPTKDPVPQWRPAFVNAMLDIAPTEEKTLRQHLKEWSSVLTSRSERLNSLKEKPEFQLISNAVRVQCIPVLEAASTVLKEAATCAKFVGAPTGWPWGMSMLYETNQKLNPDTFQKAIEIYQSCGMDFNRVFDYAQNMEEPLKLKKASMVHLLAESKHQDTPAALMELLKADVDTKVKNTRGWVPSSCLGSDDLKKEWMGIERAYSSRQQAMDVLDELHSLVMSVK